MSEGFNLEIEMPEIYWQEGKVHTTDEVVTFAKVTRLWEHRYLLSW